jgi:hypothetical protein
MRAFADVSDLQELIGRTVDDAQGTALLEAASGHLRHVIGQDVFPRTTSTYTGYPTTGREDLPQWPVVSVETVERDGSPIAFTYRPGYILVDGDDPIDVTFTWGLAQVPDELKRLACVLASQALQMIEVAGGLTAGGLSSIAIDDFRAAFAEGGAASGIALTDTVTDSIRARYGRGDVHMPGVS